MSRPKPMVMIKNRPILWHIMSIYAAQGHREFVIAGGYLCHVISEWVNTLDDPWDVVVVDTGLETQTAGRLKRCLDVISDDSFFLTYGDGLGNISLKLLTDTHVRNQSIVTVTAVRPPARFGSLTIEGDLVRHFGEKSQLDEGWINGGFFLVRKEIAGYLYGDSQILESQVLPTLARYGDLSAYKHYGFWKPMDTLREKHELEELCMRNPTPWLSL